MQRDVPILMYHHVCPEPTASRHFPFAVTPGRFREQLEWLFRKGYKTIHLSTLLRDRTVSQKKRVAITFDDGARNLLEYAVPALKEFGMTATFFVPSRLLGQQNCWDEKFDIPREELMRPDDIRPLHEYGFEIGSHGALHLNLTKITSAEAQHELEGSKSDLEALLGAPVDIFIPLWRVSFELCQLMSASRLCGGLFDLFYSRSCARRALRSTAYSYL